MELETHLLIAKRLKYLESKEAETLLQQTSELGRMLNGLMKALGTSKS